MDLWGGVIVDVIISPIRDWEAKEGINGGLVRGVDDGIGESVDGMFCCTAVFVNIS